MYLPTYLLTYLNLKQEWVPTTCLTPSLQRKQEILATCVTERV